MPYTTIIIHQCPECGNMYDGEGRLGTDWICCNCGCRISAASVDKLRRVNMFVRALSLGWFFGLLFAYGAIFWGFGIIRLPRSYDPISLIFIPIWIFLIYNLSKRRKDHELEDYVFILMLPDMFGTMFLVGIIW